MIGTLWAVMFGRDLKWVWIWLDFFSNWVVGLNGTLRLLISGCDVELCDFELSLWSRWSNQQLFDQSQLYQLTLGLCDWGQRAILGGQSDTVYTWVSGKVGWSIGYIVVNWILCIWISRKVGWSNPVLMSMLALWLIYSGMWWHLHQQQEAVKLTKRRIKG